MWVLLSLVQGWIYFLLLNNSEILVKINDKVKENRTVIARLKSTF